MSAAFKVDVTSSLRLPESRTLRSCAKTHVDVLFCIMAEGKPMKRCRSKKTGPFWHCCNPAGGMQEHHAQ